MTPYELPEKLNRRLRKNQDKALYAFADALEAALVREVPVKTGALRRSIDVSIRSGASVGSITMRYYGLIVARGASPHDIPGAFGYAHPFGIGGRFSGRFHPGMSANDFISRAMASPEVAAWRRKLPKILLAA